MKGLFKYFTSIFEGEKEPEIQIGLPTDVKHVAHIGWDGPAAVESPSWMKEFDAAGGGFQSAPLNQIGDHMESPEIKWVSEDGKGRRKRDMPELPKSSRRSSSNDSNLSSESPVRESSGKTKHTRKHRSKESNGSADAEHCSKNLPHDIPKKSRKKKSKDCRSKGSDDISQACSLESVERME